MGGREAIRGFAIQTLICLLDALDDPDWLSVTVEPDSADDKVDIHWQYDGWSKAVQVKSSQNPIGKGAIEGWCRSLQADGGADKYELRLAGPLVTGALTGNFGSVHVPAPSSLVVFDLIEQAVTKLERHLLRSGIEAVPLAVRTSLVDICASRLLEGSTKSRPLAREAFDGWLLHWVATAYPAALNARLSAECEVVWGTIKFGAPPAGIRAFTLELPLTFYNAGRGVAVVEWLLLMIDDGERRMLYAPDALVEGGETGAFSDFAVGPGDVVAKRVRLRAAKKNGFSTDAWHLGRHRMELLVKFSSETVPRSVKSISIDVTGDHMRVLSQGTPLDQPVSSMQDFIDAL